MPRYFFPRPNIVKRFTIHRKSKRSGKAKDEFESDDVVSERLDSTEAELDPMYTMEPPMETAPVVVARGPPSPSPECKNPAEVYEEQPAAARAPVAPGAYTCKNDDALERKLMTRSSTHTTVETRAPSLSNNQSNHRSYQQQQYQQPHACSSPAGGVRTSTSSSSNNNNNGAGAIEIEIAPGHFAQLRGSQETTAAIQIGFSLKVVCMCCDARLVCIADAEFVLCPCCKVVSPNLIDDDSMRELVYGVGLGLVDQHY